MSLIIPIVVISASSGADPGSAGELAGQLSVAPLLAGVAVGVWAKLAKRRWHVFDYVLRFAVCTVVFFGFNALGRTLIQAATPTVQPRPAVTLTASEKQGLRVSGGWARHSDFAFVLPLGGKWDHAPDIQNEINGKLADLPGTFAWALQPENGDGYVVIFVAKGAGNDEPEFRAMARGISRGAGKQGVEVLEDALQWSRRAKEFRHAIRLADGRYAKTRCVPSESERTPYIICVQTLSPDSSSLDHARDHLTIRVWK